MPNDKIYRKIQIHLILDTDYYRIIPIICVQNEMNLNLKIAGGALMKHDIPFFAIKVVAVVKCHS